jgi:hypothetical protein
MPDLTDFLNESLAEVGASRIVGIDDNSINANHCKTFHVSTLRAALAIHFWDFAKKQTTLQLNLATPQLNWAYSHALPADYIRIKSYIGMLPTSDPAQLTVTIDPNMSPEATYEIQGTDILSNDQVVAIEYIRYVADPNVWSPLFYQMMVTFLASKLAKAITKDTKRANDLLGQAMNLGLPLAAAVDSQSAPPAVYVSDALTWGR